MLYLITGAAGFIGARFAKSCKFRGINMLAVDSLEHFGTRECAFDLKSVPLADRDDLLESLRVGKDPLGAGPKAIVHIGARTDTQEMDAEVLKRLNLDYSKSLWNYASTHRIPFVYASSAATYGGGEYGYDDDEKLINKLQPLNPYGESKRAFDLWALEQERLGNAPPSWCGFKFFNVYGPGERHKKFMASVVLHAYDEIKTSGEAKLFKSHREGIADGFQKRDFIYVDDVVDVLHFALEKPIHRGVFNLGTGRARTFLDLTRAVFSAMKRPETIRFVDTPEKLRARYQYFTEAKMARLRAEGYVTPFTSLEDGVARYIKELG